MHIVVLVEGGICCIIPQPAEEGPPQQSDELAGTQEAPALEGELPNSVLLTCSLL